MKEIVLYMVVVCNLGVVMTKIQSIANTPQPQTQEVAKEKKSVAYKPNFKAGEDQFVRQQPVMTRPPMMDQQTMMMKALEEQKKKEKKQQVKNNIITGVSVLSGLALIGLVGMQIAAMRGKGPAKEQMKELGLLVKEDFQKMYKDCSKELGFDGMYLDKGLNDKITEVEDKLARADIYKDCGLPETTKAMMLFGPPGTGKNTFTYALAKMFNEKFPGSKLLCADMTKIIAPYVGIPEKNLSNFADYAIAEAKALKSQNSKSKLIIFWDEIDRVAMIDHSSGAKHSNDLQTEFKTCFNRLLAEDNIVIIGATNKELDAKLAAKAGTGVIESALADRFGDKIRVNNPISKAMQHFFSKHFKNAPAANNNLKEMGDNNDLAKFCDIITDEKHNFSYRNAKAIIEKITPADDKTVSLNELIDATIKFKDGISLSDADIRALEALKTKA